MDDLRKLYERHGDLSEHAQVKAGQAISGAMSDEHTAFVQHIAGLIKDKKVNPSVPSSFMNASVLDALDEASRSKVEAASVNVADQLRHVAEFYLSKETPDASPHLATMIDHLWHMKKRVESEFGDVFIF